MASPPELDEVVISFDDAGITVGNWTSYSHNQHFLTPTDGWSFTLGDERAQEVLSRLVPGERVSFRVNGVVQGHGFIGIIDSSATRSGGSVMTVEGRDVFAPLVDSCVDPTLRFQPGNSVREIVTAVMSNFGFTGDFEDDNAGNRAVITGGKVGFKVSKKKGRISKKFLNHGARPYNREGAFDFLSRVLKREGLWIWPTADGASYVVGAPDFEQEPSFNLTLRRGDSSANNVEDAGARKDWEEQPTVVVATGSGAAAAFPGARLKVIVTNEFVAIDPATGELHPDVQKVYAANPDALILPPRTSAFATKDIFKPQSARALYIHDDEARTLEQVSYFAQRELALRQRRTLTYSAEVEGHTQNGAPWSVDTMVTVDDDYNNVHERLYVLSRTFSKSRNGGTRTKLELIRPGTLEFGA